jgi:hypothetical protein
VTFLGNNLELHHHRNAMSMVNPSSFFHAWKICSIVSSFNLCSRRGMESSIEHWKYSIENGRITISAGTVQSGLRRCGGGDED